ncbi:helix-turn-helix domain-containing protein [Tenacibaculum sp. UWU-22]|uniref:helix-turn-helix domain-containing protein n=1 Tax=Tenacibaculum sp. UWU-22 TaxID=3234187 RepID=UPI0034DB0369
MILVISINNIQSFILDQHLIEHRFKLDYILIPWHLLIAPFFYLFLSNYLNIAKKSLKVLKITILVFLTAIALQIAYILYLEDKVQLSELNYRYKKYTSIEEIISFITSISIFSYSFYLLYKKEKLFPKILAFDSLHWIYTFFKLGLVSYVLWGIAIIIKANLNYSNFLSSYYPLRVATTILIYWLGYQGFIQLRLLKERQQIRNTFAFESSFSENLIKENKKEHLVLINKHQEQFDEINVFIKKEKKFLQPKYTLQNLSEDVNLSPSTLSLTINNCADKSFVDYINEMRIKQAKELLTSKDYNNYTMTAIGLESGFNSKSSFYAVFKKHVGCTPFEYRNSSS